MNINYIFILVLLIIFGASLYRSTFGFGDALIAMPLLALFINIKTVTPIVAFIGFASSIFILSGHWQKLNFRNIWKLVLFSILGIPLGLIFLKGSNENIVKALLGLLLIIFSLFSLTNPKLVLKTDKSSFAFGIVSGILGGAYNSNGPPIIIYGTLRKWTPEEFRLLLQGVFLPTNLFIIIGHGLTGFWTGEVLRLGLISMPVIFIAVLLGNFLNKRISPDKFSKLINYFLILIGFILIVQASIKFIK